MIPFELSNILANFQKYINKILAEKLDVLDIMYLDNIFIYIKNLGYGYVIAIWCVLDFLWKHELYVNLKKIWFYKDGVCFLGYIVLVEKIRIKDNK